jgi:hypothetical protein
MNAGATCDRGNNLRSQVQHSDFSSSINDFCDRDEKFLKKILRATFSTPEVARCNAPRDARKPVESGFNSLRPHFEHIPQTS